MSRGKRRSGACRRGRLPLRWAKANRMKPPPVRQVAIAEQLSAADYQRAMFQRADLLRIVQKLFERAHYVVTPTMSRTALPIDQDLFEPITIDGVEVGELRRNWFPYTMPFNITGHPAITVCCGYDGEGLPVGLQFVIIAAAHGDRGMAGD